MNNYALYYEYIELPLEIRLYKNNRCVCWISPRFINDDTGTFMDWDAAPIGFDNLKAIIESGKYQSIEVLVDTESTLYFYEIGESTIRKRLTGWVNLSEFMTMKDSTKDPNRLNENIPTEFISLCSQ